MNALRSPLAVSALVLVALPFALLGGGLTLTSATDVVIFAIACMALNVLVGHTGLVSFGHGAWFGLGAYAAALSQKYWFAASVLWPMLFALAALAGVLLAPITGVHPAMGAEILTASFVVVVIGGLGSFWGVVYAALIVGVVRGLTVYYFPPAAEASMYLLMLLVLLFRPRGLFGERIVRFE